MRTPYASKITDGTKEVSLSRLLLTNRIVMVRLFSGSIVCGLADENVTFVPQRSMFRGSEHQSPKRMMLSYAVQVVVEDSVLRMSMLLPSNEDEKAFHIPIRSTDVMIYESEPCSQIAAAYMEVLTRRLTVVASDERH